LEALEKLISLKGENTPMIIDPNLSKEVYDLCLRKESSIDSTVRKKAKEIEKLQQTFGMLNKLVALVHSNPNSPDVTNLIASLKERDIVVVDPRNTEAATQVILTNIDQIKIEIQEMINSMHPTLQQKQALIQMMQSLLKLDLGVRKMIENQRPH
jgi:hypothetical protein